MSLIGYATLLALNGRETLDLALTNDSDAAILDVDVPLTNGMEVTTQIRRGNCTRCSLLVA